MNNQLEIQRLSLREYVHVEVLGGRDKQFSWFKVWRRVRSSRRCHFIFWFRVADVLSRKGNRTLKSWAKRINNRLMNRYGVEIMLGAEIGAGLTIEHPTGIVIAKRVQIGKNFLVRQNTTIGIDGKSERPIVIGDDVVVGANCAITGSNFRIGNRVEIGAMSFVNKDVPDDTTYITVKENRMWPRTL